LVQVVPAQGSKVLDLKEITSGKFRAEGIQGVIPMADGEHYTQMNAEGTQIIKYSFRTGLQAGGGGNYNRNINRTAAKAGGFAAGAAGSGLGNIGGRLRGK
jgi:hypothetical protein